MRIIIATNQILELLELARQAQANISQKTEIESQDRKDNKSKESQNNQTVKEVNQRLEAEDTEDKQRLQAEIAQLQSQNQNQDDITSTDLTLRATGVLVQEEPSAPICAPNDNSNIGNYNDNYHCSIVSDMTIDDDVDEGEVDEDPPTRSKYDQTNKGESITIMEVIAGTDVKKKDDTVVVATEGSYLSPYKALLRAGDFVFTGQPPGG